MKNIITIILAFTMFSQTQAQNKITGNYANHFGYRVELKSDSAFRFTWGVDLVSSWSVGTWTIKHDTIYFKIKPVFDTLRTVDPATKVRHDSLVLSADEKPGIISGHEHATSQIASGGQNRHQIPSHLFFHEEKLYDIDKNGKLITEEIKGFWAYERFDPWYVKE